MEKNLRNLLPLLGVFCFGATQAHADDYSMNGQDTCVKMKSAVPPGVNCPCDCGPNMYINAAYTLWTAREGGLSPGFGNVYDPAISYAADSITNGKVAYPDWKLRSGFKVGLGAYLDHDCWDIGLEYTWFYNKGNGYNTYTSTATEATPTTGVTRGLLRSTYNSSLLALVPGDLTTISTLGTQWNNWFNRIDAELGRAFYVGHYLSLRPFLGLVGAWDHQNYDVQMHFPSTTVGGSETLTTVYNTQKWWGIGPYMGFDTSFIFTNGSCNQWALFMDSGVAMPWGHYTTSASMDSQLGTATSTILLRGANTNFYNVDPMLELALGLRWETTWSDSNEWSFMLQVAWEEQVWFNHNKMAIVTACTSDTDYSMQGLTLKAQLDF